jgi:outer membrane protein OmpA-like peptidoglycan-associated protein
MNLRLALIAAFGFSMFLPASAAAAPAHGTIGLEPSNLVLAQAKAKEDDEDSRSPRGRRGGEDKGQGSFSGKGKEGDTRGRGSSDGQRDRAGDSKQGDARQQKADERSLPQPKQTEQPKQVQPKQFQQPQQTGQPKQLPPQPQQTEQQKQFQAPKQFQAEPRDGRQDRDRAARGDRDELRARMKRRETEKTSAQDLSRIKVEAGKPTVIDGGAREFRREGNRIVIRSDDQRRIQSSRDEQRVERLQGGQLRTIIVRPDGTQIITVTDARGSIIRRVRRDRNGREIILIAAPQRPLLVQLDLGPLRIGVPRDRYFLDSRRASRRDLEMILRAPPVEQVQRPYMLEEIRQFDRIRDIMPRVNVSSINFETDSSLIADDQIAELQELADAILAIIEDNAAETFMLAGHTDATGSREYNLALSERRAEAVAIALSDYFGIPAENLVTQGYGPDQLLVDTSGPERENRRVEVIRLTPLLAGN